MTKNKGGRPTAMTEEVIRKLEQVFAYGASDREACVYAGIVPSTLYKYCEENPKFSERKELLKEKPILMARESVMAGIQKDSRLALDFLKSKKREEFYEKNQTEVIEPSVIQIIKGNGKNNKTSKSN